MIAYVAPDMPLNLDSTHHSSGMFSYSLWKPVECVQQAALIALGSSGACFVIVITIISGFTYAHGGANLQPLPILSALSTRDRPAFLSPLLRHPLRTRSWKNVPSRLVSTACLAARLEAGGRLSARTTSLWTTASTTSPSEGTVLKKYRVVQHLFSVHVANRATQEYRRQAASAYTVCSVHRVQQAPLGRFCPPSSLAPQGRADGNTEDGRSERRLRECTEHASMYDVSNCLGRTFFRSLSGMWRSITCRAATSIGSASEKIVEQAESGKTVSAEILSCIWNRRTVHTRTRCTYS